jgi:hypothetical protein
LCFLAIAFGLLDVLSGLNPSFLQEIYKKDFFREDGCLPNSTMQKVIVVVKRKCNHELLERMRNDKRFDENTYQDVKQMINNANN